MKLALSRIDFVLKRLVEQSDTIARAHDYLGIPIEDCIASAARKAVKELELNPNQLDLFWQERGGKES